MPVSSSSVMKTTPLALPGPLPHQHHAGAADATWRSWRWLISLPLQPHTLRSEHLAQKFHRMPLQRQLRDGLVIGDHLLRQRHQRQRPCVLVGLLARDGCFETAAAARRRAAAAPPRSTARRSSPMERNASASASRINARFGKPDVAGEFFQRGEGPARAGGDDAGGPVLCFSLSSFRGSPKREPEIRLSRIYVDEWIPVSMLTRAPE